MKKLLVVFSLLLVVIPTGCVIDEWWKTTDVVKIGVIAPLTDDASAFWADAVNVFNFSVDRFNQSHGDVQVELIVEDWKCEWTASVNAVQKLINVDNIDILLWGWCSAETLAVGPITQEHKITTLAPGSSSPEIVNIWDHVYRFWNDNISSTKLAKYMNGKYHKALAIYSNEPFQIGLYNVFLNKFDWDVVSIKMQMNEQDYSMIAQQIENKKDSIDSIVLFGFDEFTIWLFKELKKLWILDQFRDNIFGWYQLSSNEVVEALGTGILEWMKQININMDALWINEKWAKYIEEFKENHDVQWTETFIYFDADGIELLLEAIENWARESEDFKEYFDSITAENPRSGILWNYYFNEDREAEWLENAIWVQEIHDWIWINI